MNSKHVAWIYYVALLGPNRKPQIEDTEAVHRLRKACWVGSREWTHNMNYSRNISTTSLLPAQFTHLYQSNSQTSPPSGKLCHSLLFFHLPSFISTPLPQMTLKPPGQLHTVFVPVSPYSWNTTTALWSHSNWNWLRNFFPEMPSNNSLLKYSLYT